MCFGRDGHLQSWFPREGGKVELLNITWVEVQENNVYRSSSAE